jgi:hypothetical protein
VGSGASLGKTVCGVNTVTAGVCVVGSTAEGYCLTDRQYAGTPGDTEDTH